MIPHYAVPVEYLGQAIDSVQNQTVVDWEVGVFDDANPGVQAVAGVGGIGDSRIRRITHETDQVLCTARSHGFQAARESAVVLLDADDSRHPEFVERADTVPTDSSIKKQLWRAIVLHDIRTLLVLQ